MLSHVAAHKFENPEDDWSTLDWLTFSWLLAVDPLVGTKELDPFESIVLHFNEMFLQLRGIKVVDFIGVLCQSSVEDFMKWKNGKLFTIEESLMTIVILRIGEGMEYVWAKVGGVVNLSKRA